MPLGFPPAQANDIDFKLEPVEFAAIPGWNDDDHQAAYAAFRRSCAPVVAKAEKGATCAKGRPRSELITICREVAARGAERLSSADAKTFFEDAFVPHRVSHNGPEGLLTGYYEPVLNGARAPDERFCVPILRRPPDLVNMVLESERGAVGDAYTHMRQTGAGLEPYATRSEIEQGALAGQDLEFLWLEDPVDTFFMHIQGSGRIRLPDGSLIRISYDGKNGHPYTSIGRYLIDSGHFPADQMSLEALRDWLKQNPELGCEAMWQNKSFVFFRELAGVEAESPMGVMEIPLTQDRSLAVDTGFHAIGTPVFVVSPALTHAESHAGDPPPTAKTKGFRRLMIAQDVGSAIRGPERGDIFFGSGDEAGKKAGITKHPGHFIVFLPRPRS